jgi:CspA family cold shock protein
MITGTVKWFDPNRGYGFISPDDGGNDAFVHISAVERSGIGSLSDGQKVSFDLISNPMNGKTSADNLRAVA